MTQQSTQIMNKFLACRLMKGSPFVMKRERGSADDQGRYTVNPLRLTPHS
jgi:hypothetical protein